MGKKVYVAPATQLKINTPEQEQYLTNLYEKLAFLTEQGGSELAEVLLETVKPTTEYREAMGLLTKEQLAEMRFDSDLHRLFELSKCDFWDVDRKDVYQVLEGLVNYLENNKKLKLTEKQYNELKCIVQNGLFKDKLRPKFWEICINRFIKEEDKESVFNSPLQEFKLPELEDEIQKSNDKNFINSMFEKIIHRGLNDKLSQKTNTRFFNTLFTNSQDKIGILKLFLSVDGKILKKSLDGLDPQMKEALKLELENDKSLIITIFSEVKQYEYGGLITLLENFRITITPDVLPSDNDNLRWLREDLSNRLRNLVPENEIKNALERMFEEGDDKCIIGLTYISRYDSLWRYVDEKYKTPKYLNPHMKIISESFGLSKEDRNLLLNDLKKSENCGEKYNACLIIDDMLRNADDEFIDLIIDTVELDKNSNPRLLYAKMKRVGGILDDKTMLSIIKNIKRTRSFQGYNDLINIIKQGVYNTENKELIVEFVKNFGIFYKFCSKEEIDTFITKFIHVMSYEDVKIFKDIIAMDYEINSPLLFKFKCFMEYIDVLKYPSLPKDVYIDAIKKGKLGLDSKLPKVDPESLYIDPNDLSKSLELLKKYDGKRSKETIENIIKETIKDGGIGEMIFNFTKQEQKYILSIDYEKGCLKFITENLEYHRYIHHKYVRDDGKTVGGGRIKMNEKEKTITLFDRSEDYGCVKGDYKKAMKKMLEKNFPGYIIEIEQ